MSINNSYFSRNNTLISNSLVNSGRNPVTELFYGDGSLVNPIGFTRFIFDLDLTLLKEKYQSGVISEGCNTNTTHTLRMTNTSYFDKELLKQSTQKLYKRLGDLRTRQAIQMLDENNLSAWAEAMLLYYDKTYLFGVSKRNSDSIIKVDILELDKFMIGSNSNQQ